MTRIDAHQHFLDPARHEYPWLADAAMDPLRRAFGPEDLRPELERSGVTGTVLVQAIADAAETRELLATAAATDFVSGVVGWVDLTSPAVGDELDALRGGETGRRLVGVRHQVHDEPDPAWLCRDDAWTRWLPALAAHPNVDVKLSGMVTEADWRAWSAGDLRPFVEAVVGWFGLERAMFGSDWPVCLLAAGSYADPAAALDDTTGPISASERALVHRDTAVRAYRL